MALFVIAAIACAKYLFILIGIVALLFAADTIRHAVKVYKELNAKAPHFFKNDWFHRSAMWLGKWA